MHSAFWCQDISPHIHQVLIDSSMLWSKMIGQQKSPSHVADKHVKGKVWTPAKLDDRKRQPVDVPRNRRPNTCSARGRRHSFACPFVAHVVGCKFCVCLFVCLSFFLSLSLYIYTSIYLYSCSFLSIYLIYLVYLINPILLLIYLRSSPYMMRTTIFQNGPRLP